MSPSSQDSPQPGPRGDGQGSATVTVALDASPLLGAMTGVGAAVGQLLAALEQRDDIDTVTYVCSFRGSLSPGMRRLPFPAAAAHRLWARVPGPRLDRWMRPAQVVHGTNYVVGPSRLPRVVSVYDCWFLRHPELASAAVTRAGRVLRRAVASGAVVHASSHTTRDAVRELLNTERVEVISLAALPRRDPPPGAVSPIAELGGAPYILALGTLERRKNLARLVAAFDEVAAANSDARLVLAGSDGDDRPAVDAAIDALSAAARARVAMTGRIDESAKAWLLDHASVLAYPSLDEGFGFPLLEAMQHSLPVVASTAGSIPEVAGDAALLVAPDDIGALAESLVSALTDQGLRSRLIDAGARRVDHFSWQSTAGELAILYRRMAEEAST